MVNAINGIKVKSPKSEWIIISNPFLPSEVQMRLLFLITDLYVFTWAYSEFGPSAKFVFHRAPAGIRQNWEFSAVQKCMHNFIMKGVVKVNDAQ